MGKRFAYWREALMRGVPSLFWLAGAVTLFLGGSVLVGVLFGIENVPWALAAVPLILLVAALEGAAKMGKERDDAKAALKPDPAAPLIGGTWTGNTFEHIGQLVGVGDPPGGAMPMTPSLLETTRRAQMLEVLFKQYAASHDDAPSPLSSIPKDWADRQLEVLGETWRLDSYTYPPDPRALMADYRP